MLPKMEKEKSFTIIYADILILPIFALNGKNWVLLGNIGKYEAAPPPPSIYFKDSRAVFK